MSVSADYCCENAGDRGGGGGALVQQRRLIRVLFIWATLLTLGLAASITLYFFPKESPAPKKEQVLKAENSSSNQLLVNTNLMQFHINRDSKDVELLQWKTLFSAFIDGQDQMTIKYEGTYFLYLQVTLASAPNLSTGFMGTGIYMEKGETFSVTCNPKAKIRYDHTETYMGVIKIG